MVEGAKIIPYEVDSSSSQEEAGLISMSLSEKTPILRQNSDNFLQFPQFQNGGKPVTAVLGTSAEEKM